GIYANADGAGRAWERPCSLELLPRDDAGGFQENCGVRIRGGFSRSRDDPKHSFRFYFRSDYGVSVLRYPLFGSAAGTSIDQFDLRTAQDGSWAYTGTRDGHFINDPFVRDTLLALGQPSERGNFVHLYINGQYWGLYNTCERPEASYAANYFGGEKEDYDVLKPDPQSGYVMTVTDGNDLAWTQLWRAATNGLADDAAYFAVQGRAPDGRIDPAGTNLLEVVNLIDYLLTIIWTGDYDGPIYGDLNDGFLNNYYAFRSRRNPGGFRFVTHDAELSLGDVNENRTGTSTRGDPGRGDGPDRLNPYYLWTRLSPNREFRTLVADRIQKHFFNGGALSTAACLARFQARRDEIAGAVVAESARWGDAQHPNDPITAAEWNEAVQDKLANYLPRRSAIVLRQLQARGFWPPAVGAPTLSAAGGEAGAGRTLALTQTNSGGQILFTLDGSDPRSPGGAISPGALTYQGAIPVEGRLTVRARVKSGLAWSPLVEASFATAQDLHALRVTELMFHPPALGDVDGDEFEFIELKNAGATAFDLSGMRFASGIEFTFANGTFAAAGQFIVLARNEAHFRAKYPGIALHGVYSGHLANSGEVVTLSSADGASFLSFSYGDGPPWPRAADGEGYSLVPLEPTEPGEPNDPHSWRASARAGGSPGADDVPRSLPELHLSRDGGRVLLSWRRASADLVLETSDALGLEPIWQRLPFDEVGNAEQVRVTVELSPTAAFFRLRQSQP
ncbi:MAG: CotH kinase family protein, partial [Verrucomicrobiota bacterium]